MRTFIRRSSWLATLLSAACAWMGGACRSGPDLSTTGEAGVLGVPIDSSNVTYVAISSIALSKGVVFAARSGGNTGAGPQPKILGIGFEPPDAAALLMGDNIDPATPELALAPDGLAWITCSTGAMDCAYAVAAGGAALDASTPTKVPRPNGGGGGAAMAMVADEQALYVALLSQNQTGGNLAPDEPSWPGTSLSGLGSYPGDMLRIARADGGVQSAGMGNNSKGPTPGFSFGYAHHLIAQDARYVYTVTAASVNAPFPINIVRVEKSNWTAGPSQVVSVVGDSASGVVGLAMLGSTLAWTVALSPQPGTSGCRIGTLQTDGDGGAPGPIKMLVQSISYSCWGLALDATHAYFTVVHAQSGSIGPNGNQQQTTSLVGTRIGRVPLAGGNPEFIDVGDAKYYGPRRVLVDDTYVYGIDPRIVLRFRKDVAWSAQ